MKRMNSSRAQGSRGEDVACGKKVTELKSVLIEGCLFTCLIGERRLKKASKDGVRYNNPRRSWRSRFGPIPGME
jgi:hypothetical protein